MEAVKNFANAVGRKVSHTNSVPVKKGSLCEVLEVRRVIIS